jgi:hypothetical protein
MTGKPKELSAERIEEAERIAVEIRALAAITKGAKP